MLLLVVEVDLLPGKMDNWQYKNANLVGVAAVVQVEEALSGAATNYERRTRSSCLSIVCAPKRSVWSFFTRIQATEFDTVFAPHETGT